MLALSLGVAAACATDPETGPTPGRAAPEEAAPAPAASSGEAPGEATFQRVAYPGFSIDLIAGEHQPRGDEAQGMIKVKTPPRSQTLYWTVPTSTLDERAAHERDLLAQVAQPSGGEVGEIEAGDVSGFAARAWQAHVEQTFFRTHVVDCGFAQLVLTTMGPGKDDVAAVHRRCLSTLACSAAP